MLKVALLERTEVDRALRVRAWLGEALLERTLLERTLSGVCARLQKRQLLVHRPVLHVSSPVVLVVVVVKEGILRVRHRRRSFLHPVSDSKKRVSANNIKN
jgi:hypothetical protein